VVPLLVRGNSLHVSVSSSGQNYRQVLRNHAKVRVLKDDGKENCIQENIVGRLHSESLISHSCQNILSFLLLAENLTITIFQTIFLRGLSESSRTVIIVTASVKEDDRGGQVHTFASLFLQSATWHHAMKEGKWERDHQEDQDVGGWIILRWILERYEPNWSGSGQGQVESCCWCGNEPSGLLSIHYRVATQLAASRVVPISI
jgi:hypothetical protein